MQKLAYEISNDNLRTLVSQMSNSQSTEWHNFNVKTRVTARSPQSTYIVSDQDKPFKTINRGNYKMIEKHQQKFIENNEMITVRGWIGCEAPVRIPVSLCVEKNHANIAAMQRHLYFTNEPVEKSLFKIYYTPSLPAADFPDQRLIAVDLDTYTTRILGTDYFGESKKAGLRMWNKWVYEKGGLALHAGCKIYFNKEGKERTIVIIGLSGTGKTTTTFLDHLNSLPIQDDFCALFSGGKIYASENGCFAKTYQLDQNHEPAIYNALTKGNALLENVK